MPAAMELQKVDWRKVSTIALIFWCKVGRGIWGGGFLCLLFFYCKEFGLAVAAAGGCDEWLVIGFPTGGVTFCLDAKSNQKDQGCGDHDSYRGKNFGGAVGAAVWGL